LDRGWRGGRKSLGIKGDHVRFRFGQSHLRSFCAPRNVVGLRVGHGQCFGYRRNPLEAMAYEAETAFASSVAIFDVEKMVATKLDL
jgi:hypothetical protein